MKRLLLSITAITVSIITWAATIVSTQVFVGADDKEPINDFPSTGQRIPTAPIYCEINFDCDCITITAVSSDEIVGYELRDRYDCNIVYSPDEKDFVNYIEKLHGTFIIYILMNDHHLYGIINL